MTLANVKEQVQKEKRKTSAASSHWGKLHRGQGIYSAFAVQQGDRDSSCRVRQVHRGSVFPWAGHSCHQLQKYTMNMGNSHSI